MPSRWEGFSIALVEAAACGAAIVASDIGPVRDLLTDNVNARVLKDYENPVALAHAIQRVSEDEEYRNMICSGAVKAAEPFERRIVDALEVCLYHEAISIGPHPFSVLEKFRLKLWKTGWDLRISQSLIWRMVRKACKVFGIIKR